MSALLNAVAKHRAMLLTEAMEDASNRLNHVFSTQPHPTPEANPTIHTAKFTYFETTPSEGFEHAVTVTEE
jgi:hypothetical protein